MPSRCSQGLRRHWRSGVEICADRGVARFGTNARSVVAQHREKSAQSYHSAFAKWFQGCFNWFSSDLSSNTLGTLASDNDGFGKNWSVETGISHDIGNGWMLTPQAQLAYSSVSFDASIDPFGAAVSSDTADSLKGRLGLSFAHEKPGKVVMVRQDSGISMGLPMPIVSMKAFHPPWCREPASIASLTRGLVKFALVSMSAGLTINIAFFWTGNGCNKP